MTCQFDAIIILGFFFVLFCSMLLYRCCFFFHFISEDRKRGREQQSKVWNFRKKKWKMMMIKSEIKNDVELFLETRHKAASIAAT